MLYGEEAVRANLRNRDGKRVFFLGKGDQLTSGARDFLNRERIEILPADRAKPERYRLISGGFLTEKPEHMTHLRDDVLIPKDHPRILFRGKLDSLESELLLCQLEAPEFREPLGEILAMVQKILACEVLGEALPEGKILGLTEEELHRRSHFPAEFYGVPHFMPQWTDGAIMARLNRARCAAREAECWAVAAFRGRDGEMDREDLLRALNRLSSALYLLMIQEKAKR